MVTNVVSGDCTVWTLLASLKMRQRKHDLVGFQNVLRCVKWSIPSRWSVQCRANRIRMHLVMLPSPIWASFSTPGRPSKGFLAASTARFSSPINIGYDELRRRFPFTRSTKHPPQTWSEWAHSCDGCMYNRQKSTSTNCTLSTQRKIVSSECFSSATRLRKISLGR